MNYSIKVANCNEISDVAHNGRQAIAAVKENVRMNNNILCNYDLILMDCNMPFMDGYEAT